MTSMQDAKDVVDLTILRDSRDASTSFNNASSGYAVCSLFSLYLTSTQRVTRLSAQSLLF